VLTGQPLSITPMTLFNVAVKTGDVKNAGTDANVYLVIYGLLLYQSFGHLRKINSTSITSHRPHH
jgi:hypothetical protein